MKNKTKKIISLTIIFFAVFVSFKIISANQEKEILKNNNFTFIQPSLNFELNKDFTNHTSIIKNEILKDLITEINKNPNIKIEDLEKNINIEEKIIKIFKNFESSINYYSINDLNISNKNNKEEIIKYFENLAKIDKDLKKNINFKIDDAILDFINKKNSEKLKKLISNINEIIEFYRQIEVPSSYSFIHLQLTNNLLKTKFMLESLLNIEKDPATTYFWFLKVDEIKEEFKNLEKILRKEIKNYLNE